MLDVSFGIFAMMTIISGMVLGILAARFVYIDKQYEKRIQKYEIMVEAIIEKLEDANTGNANNSYRGILEHAFAYQDTIGIYKSRRDSNRHTGVILDIAVILTIISVGLATTLKVFEINILLAVTLLILVMIPLLHFGLHMRVLKEELNV